MTAAKTGRLHSLDALRGWIMVLLALEAAGLYEHLEPVTEGGFWHPLIEQFFHHPWNGLRFWDLIQPGFMFIAGAAMAFSIKRQQDEGATRALTGMRTLKRSGWLFFWGVLIYAVRKDGLSFELWNVLTQLSFTTLVTWLVIDWRFSQQLIFCAGLLLLTEILYRYTGIPGFDQPFTDQQNFGNWMDNVLMGKINRGGWVAINVLPTSVHTIAGAMAGRFLMSRPDSVKPLLLWGVATLAAGFLLDWMSITPIIKRIATSSFTLASLGWCLLALALFYDWIDLRGHHRYLFFVTVVGMNSIFIYLFFEIPGGKWFNEYIQRITDGLLSHLSISQDLMNIIASLVIFGLEWGMCLFLYRKKIFFKL
jgi:predicted acyltransferase